MTSKRLPGGPMLTWLQADLESTTQDWIIAFWHHPAYTKGSHNSDNEIELVEMRQYVLPILEAGGVDLVLAGHSHCYERSYLINGHYKVSSNFSAANLIDGGNGREDGTGTYEKPGGLAANQGAVYIVAGNGGHVTNWATGSRAEFNPNPHPAMFYSALHLGSLVLDVKGSRLDVKMIRESGAVDDYFTIKKNLPDTPTTPAAPTDVVAGTLSRSQIYLAWMDNATDEDGFEIERATGAGPFSRIKVLGANAEIFVDTGLASDRKYRYRVRAYNGVGSSAYSNTAGARTLGK
jgi:hypothetical protein